MKEWADRERWAKASMVPLVVTLAFDGGLTLLALVHGGATNWSSAKTILLGWGGLASLISVYLIWVIRKARREMRAE